MTEKNIEYIDDIVKEMLNGTFSVFVEQEQIVMLQNKNGLIFLQTKQESFMKNTPQMYICLLT